MDNQMTTFTQTEPLKVRRGRPRRLPEDKYDVKEYNKSYYERIYKEKTKGDYLCETCNLYCSIANKSRHNKSKMHLDEQYRNLLKEVDENAI
jgi:hypothetical protein